MFYIADTETTERNGTQCVWLWALISEDGTEKIGDNIVSLMECIFSVPRAKREKITIFFHNLKFDGSFIVNWLLSNGYKHELKAEKSKTFEVFIDDRGTWYSITINNKGKKYHIWDSYKKIPLSVEDIGKTYGKISKGEIDHTLNRPEGYEPTVEEIEYCLNDCRIVRIAMLEQYKHGLTSMTIGGDVLKEHKRIYGGKKVFNFLFPNLDGTDPNTGRTYDEYSRKAYKGAFCWANPKFTNTVINEKIRVYDVNSLYPFAMHSPNYYPVGIPFYGTGQPQIKQNTCYIIHVLIKFNLKNNGVPCIIDRNTNRFNMLSWLNSSIGATGELEYMEMWFTNIDIELIKLNYIYDIKYIDFYEFEGSCQLFDTYIDKYMDMKIQASKDGDKGKRQIAKLFLNNGYGKYGQNNDCNRKEPNLQDDILEFNSIKGDERATIYSPVAAFVTSYAREYTIKSCMQNIDRLLYCDTDSMHLIGDTDPNNIYVDDNALGAWKLENTFVQGKYLRQKTYIETDSNGEYHITAGGFVKSIYIGGKRYTRDYYYQHILNLTIDDFKKGLSIPKGRQTAKQTKGGIKIVNSDFTIR